MRAAVSRIDTCGATIDQASSATHLLHAMLRLAIPILYYSKDSHTHPRSCDGMHAGENRRSAFGERNHQHILHSRKSTPALSCMIINSSAWSCTQEDAYLSANTTHCNNTYCWLWSARIAIPLHARVACTVCALLPEHVTQAGSCRSFFPCFIQCMITTN